jgi:hypothetical protein
MHHQAGLCDPLLEIGDRGGAVIVEVRPGSEELHRLETVRRDLEEMLAGQALRVVEMRRHPELTFRHKPKQSL